MPTEYQAQLRHAAYYVNVVHAANALYSKANGSKENAQAWLKSELANIQLGQYWSAKNIEDQNAGFLCLLYAALGSTFLERHLSPDQRLGWLEPALTIVERYPQIDCENSLLISKGRALAALGKMRDALAVFQQTLSKARDASDEYAQGFALSNLGVAYFYLGESSSAIDSLEQSITIFTKLEDAAGLAQVRGDLGNVFYFLGDYPRARELFEQRLEFAETTNDASHRVGALMSLGLTHSASGRFRDALEAHELALQLSRELGDLRAEGEVLANLGSVYAVLGENDRALDTIERRLDIAREVDDIRGEAKTLFNRGVIYREIGEDEKAILSGLRAVRILEEMGDPYVAGMLIQIKEWQGGPKKPPEHLAEDPAIKRRLDLYAEYERQVRDWRSLPWWRRIITKRPPLPLELIR